ncbi:hypothetical protein Herbaro_09210 [Herbaspirillum sp. WKF16]|uniref:hypothetical protein n=1 Tax=Herbaspirillum sp. WKF16 TaxID=3028312 RepID=UPI0023A9666B|nr:hypothetical protein [Herbaspirillum sp. WKF16]WDZ97938.1 hypothetical protein Herbaro_09210 [Herbaspirillum sp. WKF16]
MDKRFLAWVGFGLVALAILSVAVSLLRTAADIVDAHREGGDLATWVGAIGTVLTLAGTIVLATQERRRSHKERVVNARLIAAGFQLRVANAQGAMAAAWRETQQFLGADAGDVPLQKALNALDAVPTWSADEVAPIQYVDPVLALSLIEFMTQYEMAKRSLQIRLSGAAPDAMGRKMFGANLHNLIGQTLEAVQGRAEECQRVGHQIYVERFGAVVS